MIVMKFGGTSNQDAAAMSNVISIVRSHLKEQPVVVISAIAKATNELEQTARAAAAGNDHDAMTIVNGLFQRHHTIIDTLIQTPTVAASLKASLAGHLLQLEQLIKGVAILRELTPRTMDAFCSHGERLSSRIIAAGLQERGVNSVWVDAAEFMVTDDNFSCAQPLTELVTRNLERVIRPMLLQGLVPVTQGFIGVTQSGIYTTMGRESSDYSASIIGGAMNATKVQIWTDVDGILTADPNVVKDIRKVKRISFEEAFELSYFGAKVLHPNTMLPVIEKQIPVQILNSKRQNGSGTLVHAAQIDNGGRPLLKSVAYKKGLAVVTISPFKRISPYLFWEGIFSVLSRHGITMGMLASSEYSIAFTVDEKTLSDAVMHELHEFGKIDVLHGKGSICLVGKGMRGYPGLVNRIFDALAECNVTMISYGASGMNLTLVINADQISDAVNMLHKEFFEQTEGNGTFEQLG